MRVCGSKAGTMLTYSVITVRLNIKQFYNVGAWNKSTHHIKEALYLHALHDIPDEEVPIMPCTDQDPSVYRAGLQHKYFIFVSLKQSTVIKGAEV